MEVLNPFGSNVSIKKLLLFPKIHTHTENIVLNLAKRRKETKFLSKSACFKKPSK